MERLKSVAIVLAAILLIGLGRFASAFPTAQLADPSMLVVVSSGGAPFYSTPGGKVKQTLNAGTVVTATGQNESGEWIRIQASDLPTGWVEVSRLIGVGLAGLSMVDVDRATVPSPAASAPLAPTSTSSVAITAT